MKYNYEFEVAEIEGAEILKFELQDPNLHLVSKLLTFDVPLYPVNLIEVLDAVLNDETQLKYWGGQTTNLEITKEKTKVFNKCDEKRDYCEIETAELRRLVNILIQERKQYI